MLIRSTFEEELLGMPCFRLAAPISMSDLNTLRSEHALSPLFAHAKISASDTTTLHRLTAEGFDKICTQIELHHTLDKVPPARIRAAITDRLPLTPAERASHAMNIESTRYRLDSAITGEIALALVDKWVAASTDGAKRVVSIGSNFLSFSDEGAVRTIDLVSILEKRRGFASAILATTLEDARDCGCRLVRVTTDQSNEAALNLYRNAGFEMACMLSVLHQYRPAAACARRQSF
jgi:GNAT superfamily N-acetyltransferase